MSTSSGSCTRFKQNAWKKELCSNCYRPKEGHVQQERIRPLPQLYLPLKPPSQGILNLKGKNRFPSSTKSSSTKKKSVRFTKNESEIIGYGGGGSDEEDDGDDDGDEIDYDDEDSYGCDTDEYNVDGEEEKALAKLTKNNTDFNSVLSNLLNDVTNPLFQPQQPLSLGAKHNKQTLQVSIQPFGSPSSTTTTTNSIAASRKSHLHKLLEDPLPKQQTSLFLLGSSPNENDDPLRQSSLSQQPQLIQSSKERKLVEVHQPEVPIKTVVIESAKKEERGNPEGRKTHIQRGNVITKSHEQVKNKLYIQNIAQKEKRNSLLQDKTNESEDLKTLIIRTDCPDLEDQENNRNLEDSEVRKEKKLVEDSSVPVIIKPTKLKIESEVTVKVLKLLNGEDGPAESREMAGEPDGKADSDEPETPLTPPPRTSFLHRDAAIHHHHHHHHHQQQSQSQPQLTMPTNSTPSPNSSSASPQTTAVMVTATTSSTPTSSPLASPSLHSPSSSSSSSAAAAATAVTTPVTSTLSVVLNTGIESKPTSSHSPSATSPSLPTTPQLFVDHSSSSISGGSSPGSDCVPTSPGLLLARCKRPAPKPPTSPKEFQQQQQQSPPPLPPPPPPEPVPRQRRGSSEAVLASVVMAVSSPGGTVSEKKKTRVRQTLRKLLRLGREDEACGTSSAGGVTSGGVGGGKDEDGVQQPAVQHHTRPRPQIIHPLDLNKSGVQVLPPQSAITATEKPSPDSSASVASSPFSAARPGKPPPPPRSESLNLMERLRPSPNSENNVYANLGENRCGITPVKPQRTGSLRDQTSSFTSMKLPNVPMITTQHQLQTKLCQTILQQQQQQLLQQQQDNGDHVYECVGISSVPECDMERQRTSLQYSSAGSETESDIYYPYVTFQNGECITKLKRRERGIVHSTLEENYGAVVVANYEALSHLLEQVKTRKPIPSSDLETFLKNPSWSLFNRSTENNHHTPPMKVGSYTFVTGSISNDCQDITLALTLEQHEDISLPPDLKPLGTFSDFVQSDILCEIATTQLTKCSINVLGRVKIERLNDFAERIERSAEGIREGVLILLQAIDYIVTNKSWKQHYDPNCFITYIRHGMAISSVPCVTYIPSFENLEDSNSKTADIQETVHTLCHRLLNSDLPLCRIVSTVNNNNNNKKTPNEIRSLLQTWLWGPAVALAPEALRRWLDLERATFLHGIICGSIIANQPVQDPARDFHLKFLVDTDIQEIAITTAHFNEASYAPSSSSSSSTTTTTAGSNNTSNKYSNQDNINNLIN